MPDQSIKVAFCVAYDWGLLAHSLPLVYESADTICLSIDKDRISWSGKPFSWDESAFQALLRQMDPAGKIRLLEDDFHLPGLTPMQNEVRQRMRMAEKLGKGGWHIQLDADELFLDFEGFTREIRRIKTSRKINIVCPWIILFKQDSNGFYYVKPRRYSEIEFIQIATNSPYYTNGRRNGYFNYHLNFPILHLSWARTDAEILEKVSNWGHSKDFDYNKYFLLWKNLNINNYQEYKNFHFLNPMQWPQLDYINGNTITDLIHRGKNTLTLPISKIDLTLQNSIHFSRARALLKRLKVN